MKHLLIVDDEKENRDALIDIFSSDFEIETAKDGVEAIEKTESQTPDLIILDILMPRMDGFQTCLKLRQNEKTRRVPIIFLTSKSEPETESFGLELGADDFVIKPFNKEVLKTRVNKRLNSPFRETVGEITEMGDFTIHWDRHEAIHGEEHIPLTTKEIELLRLFVENEGRLLSRAVILERVWADTYITDRTIDSHVKELRKKLPPLAKFLKTIYGSGYRLDL